MLGQEKYKWNLNDVYNVFVLVFIAEMVLFLVLKLLDGSEIINSSLLVFLVYLLQVFGMIGPLWYIAVKKKQGVLKDFGFKWIGLGKTILWVIGAYLFYLGLGSLIIILFNDLGIGSLGFEPQKSIFEIFGNDPLGIFIAFITATLIAPLTEEIFFRGFMLQTLNKYLGSVWSVCLTALIFASVHFEFQSIMPLLILSFVLNVLYVKTRSIWPGVVFHILNNSIAFLVVLFGIVV